MIDYLHTLIDDGTMLSWFVFNPKKPLLFNSGLFLAFFLIFYAIYVQLRDKKFDVIRKLYLIIFSMFFYYKAGGYTLPIEIGGWYLSINYFVVLLVCALLTDTLTRLMYKEKERRKQKLWLTNIVLLNLLMLAYFKYTGFFAENIAAIFNAEVSVTLVILPIGISFYVFEAISYAVDVYRKEMKPADSTLDFCFYIAFFPKLVAGPIIRAKDFLPQMKNKFSLTKADANRALFLIIAGLIKKAIISDYISANFVKRVFDEPLRATAIENLMAVYGYTLQIYCDFSGYSDMAIGLALLMGFKIPANFNLPYKSQSITEFWRRWHISLSSWLRDYLYIPLGGNKKGKLRTYVNLFLTMLIGGLWHGASWTFVVWGALHGVVLVIERYIGKFIGLSSEKRIFKFIRIFITFHIVAFCWIFFNAKSFAKAQEMIQSIASLSFSISEWITVADVYLNVFSLMLVGYVLHFLPERIINAMKNGFGKMPMIGQAACLGIVIWMIYATMSEDVQPLIYLQF